jgi:hypothetical protein
MRGADVGSQTAPAVHGAWPPETGLRGFSSGRLNAAPPDVPVERPLSGAAFGGCRPVAVLRRGDLHAPKQSFENACRLEDYLDHSMLAMTASNSAPESCEGSTSISAV